MKRYAARCDANKGEIVAAFRGLGASVVDTPLADGFPDICIGYRGVTWLVEIKDGSKPPSKRKLTHDQLEFHRDFNGAIAVVENTDDVIELMAMMGGCECK